VGSGRAAELGILPKKHWEQSEEQGWAVPWPAWQPAQKDGRSVASLRPRVKGSGSPGVLGVSKSPKKALESPRVAA